MKKKPEVVVTDMGEQDLSKLPLEELHRRKAIIELQAAEFVLEDTKNRVLKERARREEVVRAQDAMTRTIEDANRQIVATQSVCKHRTGGKAGKGMQAVSGLLNGTGNYATIHHTYPWGETRVICQRCCKEWAQPPMETRKSDPKEYDRLMKEYLEALAWPTDNEPSGTQIFRITLDGREITALPASA